MPSLSFFHKKGAALQAERPKRVGYWKASDTYDTPFCLPVNRNLCHIWSNDKKILNFCESLPKMPVPTFQGPGIML